MRKLMRSKIPAALLGLMLVAAACGSDDAADTAAGLAGCPNPLIVQTDWFPQPEHAYTYNMIGTEGVVNAENGTYTGEVGDTGITMEIRAGGPYVGFSPPSSQFYADDDIFMAYVDTGTAIRDSGTLPVVAVFGFWEKSPQILMWDPAEFSFADFGEIGASGAPVLYFEGSAYMDFLIGKGLVNSGQVDASYDGGPSRFVTESVIQQGFATNEVYRYENEIEGHQAPVESLLIHDSGFEIYEGTLSVKPASITEDRDCLEAIVPLFQQSAVDYMNNPEAMNIRIDEIVKELDSFWTSSIALHNSATQVMKDRGLVTDGSDGFIGATEPDRINRLIAEWVPVLESLGIDSMKDGVTADDISTNEFLDDSISLGY